MLRVLSEQVGESVGVGGVGGLVDLPDSFLACQARRTFRGGSRVKQARSRFPFVEFLVDEGEEVAYLTLP